MLNNKINKKRINDFNAISEEYGLDPELRKKALKVLRKISSKVNLSMGGTLQGDLFFLLTKKNGDSYLASFEADNYSYSIDSQIYVEKFSNLEFKASTVISQIKWFCRTETSK